MIHAGYEDYAEKNLHPANAGYVFSCNFATFISLYESSKKATYCLNHKLFYPIFTNVELCNILELYLLHT